MAAAAACLACGSAVAVAVAGPSRLDGKVPYGGAKHAMHPATADRRLMARAAHGRMRRRLALLPLLLAPPAAEALRTTPAVAPAPASQRSPRRALQPQPTPQPSTVAALQAALAGNDAKARVQREAVAAVARAFGARRAGDDDPPAAEPSAAAAASGSGARATVVLPSGAGKTVVALRAAEELRPRLTLVLVPSIALVSQSYREWERWREGDHLSGWRPLAVVSSSSVPASELPRTTSVQKIGAFLRAPAPAGVARVVFCTYHSAARVAEALDGAALDLLVCDEAHRCTGKLSKRDAQPLSDTFLRAKRRLFLTATPRLLSSRRDADGALVPAGSMDDERLFGPVRRAPLTPQAARRTPPPPPLTHSPRPRGPH